MKRTAKAPAPAPQPPRSRLIRAMPKESPPARAAKAPVKSEPRSLCPVNLMLEQVGDVWSLLVVRDLMLRGHSSYQAFLRSGEKIATNILADRLLKLEHNGMITKSPDPSDARRFIYALSEKGADLAPVLVEMILFSQRHEARIDMPKEVLLDMQRNKQAYTVRLIRHSTPKRPRKKASGKPAAASVFELDFSGETLSLF